MFLYQILQFGIQSYHFVLFNKKQIIFIFIFLTHNVTYLLYIYFRKSLSYN